MSNPTRRTLLAALALALAALGAGGCDDADELGVELEVRGAPTMPDGPLERCLEVTPTEAPLTLDRIRFEANDPSTVPARRTWADVSLSSPRAFCVDVCACTGDDEVGRFVVEDDGADADVDVDWPEDYCCELPPDGGVPDGGVPDGGV